jgi:hypothetical protein
MRLPTSLLLFAVVMGCETSTRTNDTLADGAPSDAAAVLDAASEPPTADAPDDVPAAETTFDVAQADGHEDASSDGFAPDATDDVTTDVITVDRPADARPTCQRSGVWKPTSNRIEIRFFNYWSGVSGYLQERSLLTSTQVAALDGLCLIPTPIIRLYDGRTYRVVVTDEDGTEASYRASESNYLEGNEGLPTIDIDSLDPFLSTFSCLNSRTFGPPGTVDGGPPWALARTMGTDSGCLNGVTVPAGCGQAWVKVKVDAPLAYRIEMLQCTAPATLRLFTPDGTMELAASDSGSGSPCPYVEHAFAQTGTYLISLDRSAGNVCDAGFGPPSDAFVRVRPVITPPADGGISIF